MQTSEQIKNLKLAEWEDLSTKKQSKHDQMNRGMRIGRNQAVEDYMAGETQLTSFPSFYTRGDMARLDFFAIGFELGYSRKLAEILTC